MSETNFSSTANRRPVIKVVGVGGAGGNVLRQMAAAGLEGVAGLAVDTDLQALTNCPGVENLLLGAQIQGGLSAGDPKAGRAAAEADEARLAAWLAGADLVFILAGMARGTGSGAAPVIARLAKSAGALTLGVAAMPFALEGSRCHRQAILGLARLRQEADAVIRLSNQHVLKLGDGKQPAVQLFATANARLGEAVRGIARLLVLPGLVNLDFGALRNILAGNRSECSLAAAEAEGDNRAFEVWEQLGQSPDFSEPDSLAGAEQVLVSIVGGEDLIAADFEWIISQVGSRAPQARIVFGAVVEPTFAGRLAVTLIASRFSEVTEESPVAAVAVKPAGQPAADDSRNELAAQFLSPTPSVSRPRSRFVAPAPVVSPDKAQQMYRRQAGRSRRKKDTGAQGLLPLEIVSKGRFEKCESTVYDGEDLDVPTYIRRGIILVESGN